MSESIVALLCLGFLGGVLFATVILGLAISGDKEQSDGNRGVDVCVPCGDRDRSECHRHDKRVEAEEMTLVLMNLRSVATPYEREVLDVITERIGKNEA